MHIARGLEMLQISANMMGQTQTIYPTLIWDDKMMILVDTGYPGQLELFREGMEKAGVLVSNLKKVVITHQDLDHIGSLPPMKAEWPIEVLANDIEKPYIQGEKMLLKITPETIKQALDALPAEVPDEWREGFKHILENPPHANVDKILTDGEILPYCGGIEVINTPGHTPGHISLYHQQSKTLIAGDAMFLSDGQLLGSHPQHTLDTALAKKSLKKLTSYDIQTVICYHGGLYQSNANERIAQLANE